MIFQYSIPDVSKALFNRVLVFTVDPEECGVFVMISLGVCDRQLRLPDAPKTMECDNATTVFSAKYFVDV